MKGGESNLCVVFFFEPKLHGNDPKDVHELKIEPSLTADRLANFSKTQKGKGQLTAVVTISSPLAERLQPRMIVPVGNICIVIPACFWPESSFSP